MDYNDPDAPPHGKLFTAINSALRQHDLVTIDELRRHLEGLTKEEYDATIDGGKLCVTFSRRKACWLEER